MRHQATEWTFRTLDGFECFRRRIKSLWGRRWISRKRTSASIGFSVCVVVAKFRRDLAAPRMTSIFLAPQAASRDFSDAFLAREFARSNAEMPRRNACRREWALETPRFQDTATHRKARSSAGRLRPTGGRARQTFLAQRSQGPASNRNHTR